MQVGAELYDGGEDEKVEKAVCPQVQAGFFGQGRKFNFRASLATPPDDETSLLI